MDLTAPVSPGFCRGMKIGGRFLPEEDYETDPASVVALVVGRSDGDISELLHHHGWDVRHCPGPDEVACPLVEGGSCAIRERSDAAIVYADGTRPPDLGAMGALVMCAAHGSSPAVAVVSGDVTIMDPLEKVPVFAADADPEAIVDAMENASSADA